MAEEKTKEQEKQTEVKPAATGSEVEGAKGKAAAVRERDDRSQGGSKKTFVPRRGPRRRKEKFKPEFDQKILGIRRVTRVMAGGRRFSFSVSMAIGDRKGRVGVGLGKAGDTAAAIEKAFNDAKRNMVRLPLGKDLKMSHPVEAKYTGSRVLIMPAPGKGLVAGGAVRTVLDLAGVQDVSAKILSRSKNALNNARVSVKALMKLKTVSEGSKSESVKEAVEAVSNDKQK